MKLHHTEYKKNYVNYILDCINLEEVEDYGLEIPETMQDINNYDNELKYVKTKYILTKFYDEQGWNIARVGKQKAIAEWLSGLALNIEYYYTDIVELAKRMGSIEDNPSNRTIERVEQGYWDFMANIIIDMENKLLVGIDN
jgi:hypothetical protein